MDESFRVGAGGGPGTREMEEGERRGNHIIESPILEIRRADKYPNANSSAGGVNTQVNHSGIESNQMWIKAWEFGWMDGWMVGWMDGWMGAEDSQLDEIKRKQKKLDGIQ